jgi:hypothetical protein
LSVHRSQAEFLTKLCRFESGDRKGGVIQAAEKGVAAALGRQVRVAMIEVMAR